MNWINIRAFLERVFAFNEQTPLLFTQFYFWAFFAFVMVIFSIFHSKRLLRNAFLFAVSLFFYYKTSGLFLLILIFSTCSDFVWGQCIAATEKQWKKRLFLFFSVIINLGVLFYFKYAYFVTNLFNDLFHSNFQVVNYLALWTNNLTGSSFLVDRILLPVGISFYTFQTISYSVDVYRGKVKPVTNILDFGFYVSFFPQLVAGPIVRANEFIPQLYEKFFLTKKQFGIAVFWILNGLAKKMILSDYLAVNFIDRVFANPLMFTGFENLMALFSYSLQVYADFSGYTDIAIGIAMIMGFYLPKNFNSPYKATNPSNFWKRWHISLSKWLQSYLYIPLGGNRNATAGTFLIVGIIALIIIFLANSIWVTLTIALLFVVLLLVGIFYPNVRQKIYTNINLMNTMLLGGLWHGASWNFMIWGGLNGVGILSFKIWRNRTAWQKTLITASLFAIFVFFEFLFPRPIFVIGEIWTGILFIGTFISFLYCLLTKGGTLPIINRAWSIFTTFVFITFTRLFFRSGSNLDPATANKEAWETAQNMVAQIGGHWNWSLIGQIVTQYYSIFVLFAIGMIIHWLPERWKRWYRYNFACLPLPLMAIAVVVFVFILYQFNIADFQAFIYFQF